MNTSTRIVLAAGSLTGMVLFFILQDATSISRWIPMDAHWAFLVSKTLRFLLNDFLAMGLVLAVFPGRQHLVVALLVQAFGLVFLLIPYFILKLGLGMDNGPLVSFLHRLVLNPILMLLLLPGFWWFGRAVSRSDNG